MFTVKATYRGQTRKFSFPDNSFFPSFDQLCNQLYRVFPISQNYYLSKLLFSPDSTTSSRILLAKEVHSAADYADCIRSLRARSWSNALLKFTVYDENPHKAPTSMSSASQRWSAARTSVDGPDSTIRPGSPLSILASQGIPSLQVNMKPQPLPPPPPPPISLFHIPPPPLIYSSPPRAFTQDHMDVDQPPVVPNLYPDMNRNAPQPAVPPKPDALKPCSCVEGKKDIQNLITTFKQDLDRVLARTFGALQHEACSDTLPNTSSTAAHEAVRHPGLPQQPSNCCPILCCSSCKQSFKGMWFVCERCFTIKCSSCRHPTLGSADYSCSGIGLAHDWKDRNCLLCLKQRNSAQSIYLPSTFSNSAAATLSPLPPPPPPAPFDPLNLAFTGPITGLYPKQLFPLSTGANSSAFTMRNSRNPASEAPGSMFQPMSYYPLYTPAPPLNTTFIPPSPSSAASQEALPWPIPHGFDQQEGSPASALPSVSCAATSEPAGRRDSSPIPEFPTHDGVVCDACGKTIQGIRHKCLDCPDFDLCTLCINTGLAESHNPFHEFFEIKEPGRVIVHTVFSGIGERSSDEQATATHRSTASRDSPTVVDPAPASSVHNATCDLCDSRIHGDRYKCLHCPDFDTCSRCFTITPEQHPEHAFVKINDPKSYIRRAYRTPLRHFATCDGCRNGINGVRFKCMHPDCADFDLCANCEAIPIPIHPKNHPMLKMNTPDTVVPTVYRFGGTQLISDAQMARGRSPVRESSPQRSLSDFVDREPEAPAKRDFSRATETPSFLPPSPPLNSISPGPTPPRSPASRAACFAPSWTNNAYPLQDQPMSMPPIPGSFNAPAAAPWAPMGTITSSPSATISFPPLEYSRNERRTPNVFPRNIFEPPCRFYPPDSPESTSMFMPAVVVPPSPDISTPYYPLIRVPSPPSGIPLSFRNSPDLHSPSAQATQSEAPSRTTSAQSSPALGAPSLLPLPALVPAKFALFDSPVAATSTGFAGARPEDVDFDERNDMSLSTRETSRPKSQLDSSCTSPVASAEPFKLPPLSLDHNSDLFREFWPRVAQEFSHLLSLNIVQPDSRSPSASGLQTQSSPTSNGPASETESPLTSEPLLHRPDPSRPQTTLVTPHTALNSLAALLNVHNHSEAEVECVEDLPSLPVNVPADAIVVKLPKPESVPSNSLSTSASRGTSGVAPLSAAFVSDVTVHDGQVFPPGAEFVKCWRMLNDGACAWPETTQLVFTAGASLVSDHAIQAVAVGIVEPGAEVELWTGELKAPESSGRCVSYWRLEDGNGQLFGHSIWIDIVVQENINSSKSPTDSLASSSVIMPSSAPSLPASTAPSIGAALTVHDLLQGSASAPVSTAPSSLVAGMDSVSDDGSETSSISLVSVPSVLSVDDIEQVSGVGELNDEEDEEDEVIWQDSRSHFSNEPTPTPMRRANSVEYVMLFDESSEEE